MSTTEETLPTPTGSDAFKAARASVATQSSDQGGDVSEGEDTPPEQQTVEQPEKVADQPEESTEENDGLLTAEELAALPAKERAKAEKWQAKLTRTAQEQSAARKNLEKWKTLADMLESDPDEAIKQMAQQRGLKLAEPELKQETTSSELPTELQFLKPVFDAQENRIRKEFEARYGPLKQQVDTITSEAIAAETESTLAQFEAKYPGWQKHEARMLELGQDLIPAKAMSDFKYMEHLYSLATVGVSEAEKTKKVVEKINKSVAAAEPSESGVPDSRVEHALPAPDKRSMRDAYAAAKAGHRWVK